MWNCGEAIQVVSDAIIRNNLILNSTITGVSASPHAVPQMRNVTIVNNTIYGNPICLYVRWSSATNMVLANNAVSCSGATAVDAAGLTGSTVTVKSNYVTGSLLGASIDSLSFFAGGPPASAFTNPTGLDFWPPPGSILIGKADAGLTPAQDFNESGRVSPFDVGAYETDGRATNPGWKVGPGFKQSSPADLVAPIAPTTLRLQ
jgi:Right handed beta helix region